VNSTYLSESTKYLKPYDEISHLGSNTGTILNEGPYIVASSR
jgi:hypothetical protein